MTHFKKTLALAAALTLVLTQAALADSISFSGTVVESETIPVYAQIGGTVEALSVSVSDAVHAGDVLATLKTTKVYATEAGTVTGIFAQPGDAAETIQNRYGAVLYTESDSRYTIAASTENAYNSTATKYVHVGENVYLSCYTDSGSHTGAGVITSITGTDYTVEVQSGEFVVGETVSVFRQEDHASSSRIGRGTLSRMDPSAYNGTGSIVSIAVADGDRVARGDLLFETLDGNYSAYYMSGSEFTAPVDGYIAALNIAAGDKAEADSVVASIYTNSAMRIAASISESDLSNVHEGDSVRIELNWNQDEDVSYDGTISMISAIADSYSGSAGGSSDTMSQADTGDADAVSYTVYIDFTPDENTRYGMSAVVYTLDDDDAEAAMPDEAAGEDAPVEGNG